MPRVEISPAYRADLREAEKEITGEVELFLAVVVRAWRDAFEA